MMRAPVKDSSRSFFGGRKSRKPYPKPNEEGIERTRYHGIGYG